jgi:hypothetical protein
MSGKTVATAGALHGLTTWTFTTLLVLYLLSPGLSAELSAALPLPFGGLGQTVAQMAAPIIA